MLKKIALLVFVPCLAICSVLFWSLPCEAGWFTTFGGTGVDAVYSVRQTSDGGYIATGNTNSFGAGSQDIWLIKIDGERNVTWQKTYGGSAYDYANSVQQTADGGYIIAGSTESFGVASEDVWVLKLDGNGDVVWQKTYGGDANYDYANSIQQTADGGYIVAGFTTSFGEGNGDAWVLKLDGNGDVVWQKTYGGSGTDFAYFVQQTAEGGYIVAGFTRSFGESNGDAWLLKLDQDGNVTWQKAYGSTGTESANSIQQTSDGGYIVAGTTTTFSTGPRDAWLLKLDQDGNVTWQKTYGGIDYDLIFFIQQTTDGGYIAAGITSSFGAGAQDAWLLKLDEHGSTGSCPFERTSTAGTTITTVTGVATTAVTGIPVVATSNTSAEPVASSGTTHTVCPFSDKPLTLKVGATRKRQGDGTIASSDGLIDCPGACQIGYNPGAMVTLTGKPSDLSTFLGWKPASLGCEGTDPCQVTMDKKKSIKAIFQGPNKLKVVTIFKNGATGTVTSGDTFINCPTDCEESYRLSSSVSLTATPTQGTFLKWTGTPCKDEPTNVCTFNIDKNSTVKAIFEGTP